MLTTQLTCGSFVVAVLIIIVVKFVFVVIAVVGVLIEDGYKFWCNYTICEICGI